MAEYINSNDDAGNLALYGGIAAAAFVGGAALAYRATSPIYKKGANSSNGMADGVIVPGRDSPASFSRGALLGSTKGLLSKNSRNKAFGEMSEAVRDSAMTDEFIDKMSKNPKAQAQLAHLGGLMDDYEATHTKALKGIGDDVKSIASIMKDTNKDIGSAYKSFKKDNPNSLAEIDDVERHIFNQENGYGPQERGVKKAPAVGTGQTTDAPHFMLNDSEAANLAARKERLANMKDHERGLFDERAAKQQETRAKRESQQAKEAKVKARAERQVTHPHAEVRKLLELNPEMSVEDIRKQVPNFENVEKDLDKQRQRARQNRKKWEPTLQERLKAVKKGVHDYGEYTDNILKNGTQQEKQKLRSDYETRINYPAELKTKKQREPFFQKERERIHREQVVEDVVRRTPGNMGGKSRFARMSKLFRR